jgi:hypothetical protein
VIRRAQLKNGPWNRPVPTVRGDKRSMALASRKRDRQREAQELAEVEGCEYKDALRAHYNEHRCALCGKWRGPCEIHHVKTRARLGKAEDQVPLCRHCHRRGDSPGNSFAALEAEFGVDLTAKAAELAQAAYAQGWLPVEQCDLCGDWHSRRFMVDIRDQQEPNRVIHRVCTSCAPEGPI